MERIITNSMIGDFANYLRSDEKSDNTIEKYLRDVRFFVVLQVQEKLANLWLWSLRLRLLKATKSQALIQ